MKWVIYTARTCTHWYICIQCMCVCMGARARVCVQPTSHHILVKYGVMPIHCFTNISSVFQFLKRLKQKWSYQLKSIFFASIQIISVMISVLIAFVLHSFVDKSLLECSLSFRMAYALYVFFHSIVIGNAFKNVNFEVEVWNICHLNIWTSVHWNG